MTDVKNERVYLALRTVAKNLIELANLGLPKNQNMKVMSFFATSRSGEHKAEIIIHGLKKENLMSLVSGCNSYVPRRQTMFGLGIGYRVPLDDIMRHIILCDDDRYESKICPKVAIFNKSET